MFVSKKYLQEKINELEEQIEGLMSANSRFEEMINGLGEGVKYLGAKNNLGILCDISEVIPGMFQRTLKIFELDNKNKNDVLDLFKDDIVTLKKSNKATKSTKKIVKKTSKVKTKK